LAAAVSPWTQSRKSILARRNRWGGTSKPTWPSPERRSHPPARSGWWASVPGGVDCPIRARGTGPNARWWWDGGDAPLGEEFLDVTIGQRESQIPAHRTGNDSRFEVAPFEQGWAGFAHQGIISGTRQPLPALQHFPFVWYQASDEPAAFGSLFSP
jgi:hypothetical protein